MEEQQEYHLDEEALSVLSLFPTRDCLPSLPSLCDYSALAGALSCGLCRQILFGPVFLRCSHRFCRDCIERYLRTQRRACPACRLPLAQHFDPRPDAALESFIAAAFGDARRLSKRLRETETEGVELRRAESQNDLKGRQRENAEEPTPSLTALKRAKTADAEEPRPKKRAPSEKKIKVAVAAATGGESERENTPLRRSKLAAELREMKKEADPPAERAERKKRRSVMVIEIDSSEPAEVQEIPREEFQAEDSAHDLSLPAPRMNPSISIIPEVSEMDSMGKIFSMRELQPPEELHPEEQAAREQGKEEQAIAAEDRMEVEGEEQQAGTGEEPLPFVPPEVMAARSALLQQFGANFLSRMLELTDFPIFMKVGIERHPQHPFTPEASFSRVKVLARTPAQSLCCAIAEDLNVPRECVRLCVCEGPGAFIEVGLGTKVQEINSRFWRSAGGFEVGEVGEFAGMVECDEDFETRFGAAWQNRLLFYFVDYSKILI